MAKYTRTESNTTKQATEREKNWNDVTGICRVYGKDRGKFLSYSTSVSTTDQDGSYVNMYVTVQFPKGKAPEYTEAFKIRILKGFLTCESWQDKRTKETKTAPRIVVQEFDFLGECK